LRAELGEELLDHRSVVFLVDDDLVVAASRDRHRCTLSGWVRRSPWSGEGSTVHANVVFVNVDASQADPARKGLHEQVIPRVSQTAGFVAGYWLEPVDGKGISVTLWESEQAAREAAGRIQPASSPTTGVKLDRIETREVIGQA
jgi:hypothetical protein